MLMSGFSGQSQGRSEEKWLGPTVEDTLAELQGQGHRHVLVAPIGFVSDHLEVLYDIDIDFKKRHFPVFHVPKGKTADEHLQELAEKGLLTSDRLARRIVALRPPPTATP